MAVAVVTAKIDSGDIDIATRENKIIIILATDIIKTERLLAKNVVKKR